LFSFAAKLVLFLPLQDQNIQTKKNYTLQKHYDSGKMTEMPRVTHRSFDHEFDLAIGHSDND